jgi:predicted membrane channel-forming protein YqfA (hemolysin III family)
MENALRKIGAETGMLVAHSIAAAVGFTGLAIASAIPLLVSHFLIMLGLSQLEEPLHILESVLLSADILLFLVVFLSGVAVYLVATVAHAVKEIRAITSGD